MKISPGVLTESVQRHPGKSRKIAPPQGNSATSEENGPRSGTAGYLAIMALQTERGRVEAELAAIDKVIERLRAL